VAGDVAGPKAS